MLLHCCSVDCAENMFCLQSHYPVMFGGSCLALGKHVTVSSLLLLVGVCIFRAILCEQPASIKEQPNWLSLWSWALLERPLDSFPAFHGTRRFNTEFTRALHLFLSWARPIQSTLPHPTSPRSILILSTRLYLHLPCGLFPSGFPTNNFTF
jgi:hypothetical protein